MKKLMLFLCIMFGILLCFTNSYAEARVYYENDFENYNGGQFATVNANGTDCWTAITSKYPLVAAEDQNGNKGMNVQGTEQYDTAQCRYVFDTPVSNTTLYISFDINRGTNNFYQTYLSIYDAGGNQKYVFYADAGRQIFYGPNRDLLNWGNTSVTIPYEANRTYKIDLAYDLINKMAYTYIDGELLSSVSFSGLTLSVKQIYFVLHGNVEFFDNLRISAMDSTSFTARVVQNPSENWLDLQFSESIKWDNSIAQNTVLKNLYTNEEINATVEKVDFRKLRVFYEGTLSTADEYQIIFKNGLNNFHENSLANNPSFTAQYGDTDFYLTELRFKDYLGNIYSLADNIPAEVKNIRLTFNNPPNTNNITDYIRISQNGMELPYTYASVNANSVDIVLAEYFFGDTVCNLIIDEAFVNSDNEPISKCYDINFTTGEGNFIIKKFIITKDGEEVSIADITADDTIRLEFEAIKTIRQPKEMVLSYSVWNERRFTGFNFQNVGLSETETYINTFIDIPIKDIGNLKIKGFLWRGLNKSNPILTELEIK